MNITGTRIAWGLGGAFVVLILLGIGPHESPWISGIVMVSRVAFWLLFIGVAFEFTYHLAYPDALYPLVPSELDGDHTMDDQSRAQWQRDRERALAHDTDLRAKTRTAFILASLIWSPILFGLWAIRPWAYP